MKSKSHYLIFALLALTLPARAQFVRSSDSNAYPYTLTVSNEWTFVVSRPPWPLGTNYNFAVSNMWTIVSNVMWNHYGFDTNQFETLQTTGGTNFSVPATYTFGKVYTKIIATNDVSFTNVSGIGSASVRVLPNGSDRWVYFPTNWAWLGSNVFTLTNGEWRATLTDGVGRIGWLSVVADGAAPTNVAALWRMTP